MSRRKTSGIQLRGDGKSDNWLLGLCQPEGAHEIPLVHVTQAGLARDIIRTGRIHVRQCNVFTGERLIYFFAMRPDYKKQSDHIKDSQIDHFPAVLVFNSRKLHRPRRIVPFDSGAAREGYFDQAFLTGASRHIRLEDYELLPSIGAVSTFIENVFGSKSAYFRGELKAELIGNASSHGQGAESYVAIACLPTPGKNEPDQRASAIEIAYDRSIDLAGNLEHVILPETFMERPGEPNDEMRAHLKDLGISPDTYAWSANVTPESRRELLREKTRGYFIMTGQL